MPVESVAFYQDQQPASGSSPYPSAYPGQGAPVTAQELQGLVAPIALYPDALVAQILSASTFPDQIAVADNWLQQNKNLTGSTLAQAVNGPRLSSSSRSFPRRASNSADFCRSETGAC